MNALGHWLTIQNRSWEKVWQSCAIQPSSQKVKNIFEFWIDTINENAIAELKKELSRLRVKYLTNNYSLYLNVTTHYI